MRIICWEGCEWRVWRESLRKWKAMGTDVIRISYLHYERVLYGKVIGGQTIQ